MKQSELNARLLQRIEQLEAQSASGAAHDETGGLIAERAWLGVYGHVLSGLIVSRRAFNEELLVPLETLAANAADRACARAKGGSV